jgi:hypothetical protein
MASVPLAVVLLAMSAAPVRAEEHEGGRHEEGRGHEGERFREGGRIEHFHEGDYHVWHGGHWEHGDHDGRYGWWWLSGGLWYYYPAPIYPYPDPYVPPPVVVAPPVAVAPPQVSAAPPPPAPQYWYYCDSARGYYPYVPACPSGWRAVPANPAR